MGFSTAAGMDACAITSEAAIAARGNQLPFYFCSCLEPADFQTSQLSREHGFEISTLQATQLRYQYESTNNCHFHRDERHENWSDSTATTTISPDQSTSMEMDNIHLLQISAPASGNRSSWSTNSTVDQSCQSFTAESSPNRYPSSLKNARKSLDPIVQTQCCHEDCQTSFDTRPEALPDSPSITLNKLISERSFLNCNDGDFIKTTDTQPFNLSKKASVFDPSSGNITLNVKMDDGQCPKKGFVFQPNKDRGLQEALWIQASTQRITGTERIQLEATSVPYHNLRRDSEEPAIDMRQDIINQDRGRILCTDHLVQIECGSLDLIDKGVRRRSKRPKSKPEQGPEIPNNSSEDCIYRAARGFAVHPRSIAERVRRSRIAQRVKVLETKLPDSIKSTGKRRLYTDEMLERTIMYIKWLQTTIQMHLHHEMTQKERTGCSSVFQVPLHKEIQESRFH